MGEYEVVPECLREVKVILWGVGDWKMWEWRWCLLVIDQVLGCWEIVRLAQGRVVWGMNVIVVVGVPKELVVVCLGGGGVGGCGVWIDKGVGGKWRCHGGGMEVDVFDVISGE